MCGCLSDVSRFSGAGLQNVLGVLQGTVPFPAVRLATANLLCPPSTFVQGTGKTQWVGLAS